VGIEVWFDQSELRGGDAWDRKIRDQIRHCALFIPIISAHSQARLEGYFRREWKFAVERKRDIADELAFLLPVVIDETPERGALVPEGFHEVQWTRLPGGAASQEFIQHVSRLLNGQPHRPKPAVQALQPRPVPAPGRPAAKSKSGSPWRMWLLLIAAATAVIIGYIGIDRYVLRKGAASSAASGTATTADKSIAVLPFVDLSEKHDQEYFADGMAEEVIGLLANIPGLKVIGRTSSFQFKGKNQDLRAVGNALGARYVVEGSVRKSGDRVRVTAQLIDSQDAAHVWSNTYDELVGDALKVQDQIATGLVRALQISIGADYEAPRSSFKSAEAYDLYLRGRHAAERNDKEGLERGAAYFQQALDLEPNAVSAVEWLAAAQLGLAAFSYVVPQEGFERARSLAQHALALDPNSWAARVVLSSVHLIYDWDWAAAERDAREALRLKPRQPDTLGALAEVYRALGRWDEGIRLTQAALAADPFDAGLYNQLSGFQLATGHFREAEASIRRMLQISPDFGEGHYDLGEALLLQGNFQAALAEMQQEQTDWSRYAGLAMVYHALGRPADSDAALAEVVKGGAEGYGSQIAAALAYREDTDQAFTWLARAYRAKDTGLYFIKGEPILSTLRGDPRYAAFLRKMNLPD
jgi:TolB-like protein/Flp pilus assembly protein TadD